MPALAPDEIKNILYILPVVSGLVCMLYVSWLRRRSARETAAKPAWPGLELLGGAHAISMASATQGGGGGGEDDLVPVQEKHVGLIIEYDEEALKAHARKALISGNVSALRGLVSDVLTSSGLVAADSGLTSASVRTRSSRALFSGSLDRMTRAARRLREELPWLMHEEGRADVGVAYTVQTGVGRRQRIHFEPAPMLFNQA